MTVVNYGKEPDEKKSGGVETGDQLHRWRVERGLTAKRLGELIEVTERSIHRAERGGRLSARIKVAMKLLEAGIAHGEITLSSEDQAFERIGRRRDRDSRLREPEAKYGTEWHGQLRTGGDIRAWRQSVGLYVKELAELLGVVGPSMMRAERSDATSSRIMYGVELLRAKVLSGELDLRVVTERRPKRGRPKKN
jgi:transcriptional regulator with XRE-family HTH domain